MNALGIFRISLIAILLITLAIFTFVDLTKFVDSPIGIKDELEYGQIRFFPAVTVCPFADSEVKSDVVIDHNFTFEEAIRRAMGPVVYEKYYMTFK